ncbi:AraC family transcriptional regulator [Salegentibacter mishustinae]|uniref:AraC family transcriptional regulator n=1 Tax=Salegentibacter mishustinae TaxID=270918 RepID=A0A0Q9ZND3_9FLAO|nr:AraC family transcriptional regulator [Salegentibacter mishustinae]KRG30724.1 AraC family transcriptional regulator [Salegentibacter mishustinae]PNW23613.1 AraC family transcriptional regulator [Salegentibacter mishustinae]PZX66698.1 AraC-like DNA-binding protein [Salegentibacter mishustinae]
MNTNLSNYNRNLKLKTSIENRTIYSADYAELNVFETRQVAESVNLQFSFPIIASMLTGKKIMHLEGMKSFDFFPGESVVLPSDKKMVIDFPLANSKNPTRCLALGIDPDKIKETVEIFNENTRIDFENDQHSFDASAVHLANNQQVQFVLDRIFSTFLEDDKAKDALLDLMVKELIIRLLQTKAKVMLLDNETLFDNNRMAFIVKYMREHLTENIQVDKLADKACMSTSNFYRSFKNTLGESPIDYLNGERIKFAKKLIQRTNDKFADIAYKSGFNNTSYFNRQFKRFEKITPNQYRKLVNDNIS